MPGLARDESINGGRHHLIGKDADDEGGEVNELHLCALWN